VNKARQSLLWNFCCRFNHYGISVL